MSWNQQCYPDLFGFQSKKKKKMFVPEVNLPFSVNGALLGCMLVCL